MNQCRELDNFQYMFIKGTFISNFEKPLLNMITKEKTREVRENAFALLIELKKTIGYS